MYNNNNTNNNNIIRHGTLKCYGTMDGIDCAMVDCNIWTNIMSPTDFFLWHFGWMTTSQYSFQWDSRCQVTCNTGNIITHWFSTPAGGMRQQWLHGWSNCLRLTFLLFITASQCYQLYPTFLRHYDTCFCGRPERIFKALSSWRQRFLMGVK